MVFIRSFILCIYYFIISSCIKLNYSDFKLYKEGNSLKIVNNSDDFNGGNEWLSEVSYSNDINQTGFAYIEIKTNPNNIEKDQAYYAGFVEGLVTPDLIYSHWNNIVRHFCKNNEKTCTKVRIFLKENTKWIKHSIKLHKNDSYWQHIDLFYTQLRGILDGYNENPFLKRLTWTDILWINFLADIDDLNDAFTEQQSLGSDHCSVLIKVLPENKDIYFGHNTWTTYQSMLRFQKKYILYYNKSFNSTEKIPGVQTTFSGYPGVISSIDDFYLISSGLATTETTNSNFNKSLWDTLTPKSVLESVRSVIANRLANSGQEWSNIFKLYNSGTYNNQWMILDYKKFKPGQPPTDGAFFVIEQLPTIVISNDLTNVLNTKGYWSSYNIPYYKDIYELAGYPEQYNKYGNWFSHEDAPRAKIFRRDHVNVKDMTSFMALMRSNDYKSDPFAHCLCTPPYSATGAIAARDDLNPSNGTYQYSGQGHRPAGAIDAKITNFNLALKLQFIGVSGPTTGTDGKLPVFYWSKSNFTETPHLAHPDRWDFKPVLHKWKLV